MRHKIPKPIDSDQFENMICDLYKKEYPKTYTDKFGRRGQKQNGVDIFISEHDHDIGIQCKVRSGDRKLNVQKDLLDEIKKAKNYKPKLKKFILATTASRDAHIQTAAQVISKQLVENFFSVEILFWEGIEDLLNKHIDIYQKYYPQFFSHAENKDAELNRINDSLVQNPLTISFQLPESFKNEEWNQLEDKSKYRVLTNMGSAKMDTQQYKGSISFSLEAIQFNKEEKEEKEEKEDIDANFNCALRYFLADDFFKARPYIEKVKQINPYHIGINVIEISIKDKEGKPLNAIIDETPKNIKKDYRIAHIFSYLSLIYNEYKETKKWLDIFYTDLDKSLDKNNLKSKTNYADISLRNILTLDSVSISRRIPDHLKPEIKKILEFYEEIINDTGNETKNSIPELYLHCGLAFELDGDIDRSIEVLKTGIRLFPNYSFSKMELARLLKEDKKDIKKAISIVELIEDKPLDFQLILSDWYFQDKQEDKSISRLREILESPNITEDEERDVRKYLIFRLNNLKKIKESEKELSFFKKDDLSILILKSQIENLKNNKDQREKFLKKAIDFYKTNKNQVDTSEIYQLTDELYFSEMYQECEPFLEKIIDSHLEHPFILKLLNTYFQNNKNNKTIGLAKKLIKKFPNSIYYLQFLYNTYKKLKNTKKAIKCCEQFLIKNSDNEIVEILLIQDYIAGNQIEKAKPLLSKDFNLDILSPQLINNLSLIYLKINEIKKCLDIQYKSICKNPGDPYFKHMYFYLFLSHLKDKGQEYLSKFSQTVQLDCYIEIQDIETKDSKEIIIEKDGLNGIKSFSPSHPLSEKILGKKINDTFKESFNEYKIIKIKSKYEYKFEEVNKYLDSPSVKSIFIPEKATGEEIIDKISQLTEGEPSGNQKIWEKYLDLYINNKATLGVIAERTAHHPLEMLQLLITSPEYKFISAIPALENYELASKYLNSKNNIILDLLSVAIIHFIGLEKHLEQSNLNLYISQSTIDSLESFIDKCNLFISTGRLIFNPKTRSIILIASPEQIKNDIDLAKKMIQWCKEKCKIQSISPDLHIDPNKMKGLEIITGNHQSFIDSILCACNEKDMILLCEDGVLRECAKGSFGVSGVRLFDVIEYFFKINILNKKQEIYFKSELIKYNQSYIPIDYEILFYLLKQSNYDINSLAFQRGLFFIGSISYLPGSIHIAINFLFELFSTPEISDLSKEEIAKEILDKLLVGRSESKQDISDQIINEYFRIRSIILLPQEGLAHKFIRKWSKTF